MNDLRSSVLALVLWGVALALVYMPGSAWATAGAAAGLAALAAMALRRRSGAGLIVLALLCGAAVATTVAGAQPQREMLAENDGHVVEALVEVTSSTTIGRDGRLWFDAQTVEIGPPLQAEKTSAPVRVGIEPIDGAVLGAQVRVTGQAKATDAGERAALVIFGTRAEIARPATGIFAIAATTRADFIVRATRLPEPGAGLLPGLAVGDTRAVSNELNAAMLASGLSHLTAVSGANCAIVVAAVFWVVSLLGGSRALRVGLALLALGAFVVLVTPEPSVIRASVMAALAMLTILLGRPSAGLAMLSLAVCGLLVADPWLAATPGFALSAAATGALLVLSRPLMRGLGQWMPQPLALALSVPLAAQVVCGPIVALFSDQQSIVGVAANLLAAPAAPVATVIGLLACLAAPAPLLADLFAAAAWLPAAWIQTTATVSASLPGATVAVVAGPLSAAVVAVLSIAATLVLVRPRSVLLRRSAAVVVIVALAIAAGRALLAGPLAAMRTPQAWSIAMCDVGQGDAVLIRSQGRTALVDTGPDPTALQKCLAATGTTRIDLLVITHFDLDHVGAAGALEGRVGTVLHGPPAEAQDEQTLQRLASSGAKLVPAAAGMHGRLGDAEWRVLWPERASAAYPPGNDASAVIEIGGGGVPRMLMLGDLSAAPQRALLARGIGRYPVVKVSHHGSGDQEPALYAAVGARVALIGVGEDNDYGHPRDDTLRILQATGTRVLRTDQHGLVLLGQDDGRITIWAENHGRD
ncbi:ComEC/Rec2 family competence protein [Microbacterium esteraromaticum]|uniref:ComEC/Rec2 family competence protein n=1 Tax=Microbacterium esteraromaticum TaxID=57043 RepID=UPI001CD61C34|nr:ComEC/Rec2 family competence protein [Microbacterium esteraromaticum]MCA1306535.1 ComEC/Rec2 family competence protein [Microbacterium esteraromaticum]